MVTVKHSDILDDFVLVCKDSVFPRREEAARRDEAARVERIAGKPGTVERESFLDRLHGAILRATPERLFKILDEHSAVLEGASAGLMYLSAYARGLESREFLESFAMFLRSRCSAPDAVSADNEYFMAGYATLYLEKHTTGRGKDILTELRALKPDLNKLSKFEDPDE